MPLDHAAFRAALDGDGLPPDLAGPEAARRFAVYRNNVSVSLAQALALRFPVIQRLVGRDFFTALAQAYRRVDPPRSPVLAEWGQGFAAFLDGFAPLARWPYMADVARIEAARGRAYHAADAPPLDPAALVGADPARLRLRLHPSVVVLRLAHPAVAIWARNQPGAAPLDIPAGPQVALILRTPRFAVPVEAVSPAEASLIEALRDRLSLADAVRRSGIDPAPRLVALMRQGAIIGKDPR